MTIITARQSGAAARARPRHHGRAQGRETETALTAHSAETAQIAATALPHATRDPTVATAAAANAIVIVTVIRAFLLRAAAATARIPARFLPIARRLPITRGAAPS
jgi:hypothetical protein